MDIDMALTGVFGMLEQRLGKRELEQMREDLLRALWQDAAEVIRWLEAYQVESSEVGS